MNVTIKFEEGSEANGCSSGPRPRRNPKPELIFTRNPLRPFKIRSYTCLKCCKRVEVQPGGYLQNIDSSPQNPCTQLLCSDCFQTKTHSHPSFKEDVDPNHTLPHRKTENGTSSETESDVRNDVLRSLSLEEGQGQGQVPTKTEEADQEKAVPVEMKLEIPETDSSHSIPDNTMSDAAAVNSDTKFTSNAEAVPVGVQLAIKIDESLETNQFSGDSLDTTKSLVKLAANPKMSKLKHAGSPESNNVQVPIIPGRINLTEKACEMIKQGTNVGNEKPKLSPDLSTFYFGLEKIERKQRELKLFSPPVMSMIGVSPLLQNPDISSFSSTQQLAPTQENSSMDVDNMDSLRRQIQTNWHNLPGTGFVRSLPIVSEPKKQDSRPKLVNLIRPKAPSNFNANTTPEPELPRKAGTSLNLGECDIPVDLQIPDPDITTEMTESLYFFKCPVCPEKRFMIHKSLDDHLKDFHQGSDLYPCPHCEKTFSLFSSFLAHKSAHLDMIEYLCKYCAGEFSCENDYCAHLQLHKIRTYKCHLCEHKFTVKGRLDLHLRCAHPPVPVAVVKPSPPTKTAILNCSKCEMTFKYPGALTRHFESEHVIRRVETAGIPIPSPLPSSVPVAVSQNQSSGSGSGQGATKSQKIRRIRMRRWIPRIPIGSDEYQCSVCEVNCPTYKYLQRHLSTHSEVVFRCHLCAKGYVNRAPLERHLIVYHSEVRPYSCKLCHKSFKLNSQLKSHVQTHSSERPYSCPMCTKTFLNQSYVNCHIRYTHLGIKNYLIAKQKKLPTGKRVTPAAQGSSVFKQSRNDTPTVIANPAAGMGSSIPTATPTEITMAGAPIVIKRKYTKRVKRSDGLERNGRDPNYYERRTVSNDSTGSDSADHDIRRSGRIRKASSRYT